MSIYVIIIILYAGNKNPVITIDDLKEARMDRPMCLSYLQLLESMSMINLANV